ncbi:MAG: RHS repeat-associated core domain-containing protein [Bacteroidales bacterium]|nr:RHS repeat-associated core domain-containing protein [Bacteroidales bacterium]
MEINTLVILAKEVKQNNKRGRLNPPVYKSPPQTRTKYVQFSLFAFTGKERDEETGFGYFGARYMDHELMTMWLSVDPMMDKYPNVSPYNYCLWNPVKLVDPDGNFPVSLHKKMVEKALGSRSVGSNVRRGLLCGTGVYSDWFHASNSSFHMDNMKGTESIKMLYNEHMKGFSDNMDKGDYVAAGADLHAIADFYSHSNYVDLYQQYFESRGEAVSVTSIKPFSEMMKNQDFMDFVGGQGGLKTGTFSIKGWFTEFFLGKAPEQGSHSLMNMDYGENPKKSPHGIESFGLGGTKHQAASEAAQKEINKLIEAKLPQ